MAPKLDLATVDVETLQPHIGSEFVIDGVPPMTLDHVRWGSASIPGGRTSFALEFSAAHEGYLPQGTYLLRHAVLGDLELFLVPHGPERKGRMTYGAVFG
mgnify:CR=1 FL=1